MKIRVFPEVLEVISISFIYNSGFSGKKIFRQIKDENTCLWVDFSKAGTYKMISQGFYEGYDYSKNNKFN